MPGTLDRKTALVTGAAGGIGLAIAEALAREGAAVVIADRNEAAAHQAADHLRAEGRDARAVRCDVAEEADVQAAIDFAGGPDILINNAGFQHVAPLDEFPTDVFERMLRVMVIGPFLGMKHAIPAMKKRGWGRILSIASINGLVGFAGKAGYNSAKHGVIGLTKVAALEVAGHGITVNALCPGYVDTPLVRNQLRDLAVTRGVPEERVLADVIFPLVPQRRLLEPREVADYAVFLASDLASGVTGQAVVLDGGYTVH